MVDDATLHQFLGQMARTSAVRRAWRSCASVTRWGYTRSSINAVRERSPSSRAQPASISGTCANGCRIRRRRTMSPTTRRRKNRIAPRAGNGVCDRRQPGFMPGAFGCMAFDPRESAKSRASVQDRRRRCLRRPDELPILRRCRRGEPVSLLRRRRPLARHRLSSVRWVIACCRG